MLVQPFQRFNRNDVVIEALLPTCCESRSRIYFCWMAKNSWLNISHSPLAPNRPDRVLGFVVWANFLWQSRKRKISFLSAIHVCFKIPVYWTNLLWQKLLNFLWLDSGSKSIWETFFPYVIKYYHSEVTIGTPPILEANLLWHLLIIFYCFI